MKKYNNQIFNPFLWIAICYCHFMIIICSILEWLFEPFEPNDDPY